MKSRKTISISIVILGIIGAILIYQNYKSNTEEKPQDEIITASDKVTIGYSRLRISLPVFVAEEEGIFTKHGINAELIMYDTAQPLMQSILAGNINVGGYTALPITFNGMLRSGKPLYFISAMIEDQEHRISYLLRAKSANQSNQKIVNVGDLKGKRIGILPTIAYKAWIEEILRKNNLDPEKDVIIQQIAPAQQAQALKNGAVDALFTNDPAATSAIELGVAELVSQEVESPKYIQEPFVFGSFNVDKEWADNNQDLYKRLVLSLDEAVTFVNNNPNKAKAHMKNFLPDAFKDHLSKYPDALYWSTEKTDDDLFNQVSELYEKIGIIPEALSLDGLIE
tara:strand:+ start:739271 stop:740287 length:1017 start_codon:yes stop_codon:yes gene_type:complete